MNNLAIGVPCTVCKYERTCEHRKQGMQVDEVVWHRFWIFRYKTVRQKTVPVDWCSEGKVRKKFKKGART